MFSPMDSIAIEHSAFNQHHPFVDYLDIMPGYSFDVGNMPRMTLNEFQGFLFNILLILNFDTTYPLSSYELMFRDDLKTVSMALKAGELEKKGNSQVTLKNWLIKAS